VQTIKGEDILPGKPLTALEAGSGFMEKVKVLKWYKVTDRYCVKYSLNEADYPKWSVWSAELFQIIREKQNLRE